MSDRRARLGEYVANRNEFTNPALAAPTERFVAGEHIDEGKLSITRWGHMGDELVPPTFNRKFRPGDFLLHSRNPGKRALAEFEGITGEKLFVLAPTDAQRLDPSYLALALLSGRFDDFVRAHVRGSVNKFLNWGQLAEFEFVLPAIDEQRRRAAVFIAAMQETSALRDAHSAATVARHALLRERLDAAKPLKAGWESFRLGEHFELRSGATPKRSEKRYFNGGDIPWVKTLDLNEGVVQASAEQITDVALRETSCKLIAAGSLLVGMYGGFGQIGRTGLLAIEAATNQAVCALTGSSGRLIPELAMYGLQANRKMWRRVAASSRKDPNIKRGDVAAFAVVAPSRLTEQMEVLSEVRANDALVAALAHAAAHAASLRSGLASHLSEGYS